MRRLLATSVILALIAAALPMAGAPALAYQQPSLVPVSWELNFKYSPLERVFVTVDGKEKPYWYMRYTVINNSGRDVLFTPDFEIVADTGQVVHAFKDVPNAVFDKIKDLYKNPLLQSPNNIYGKLLQGEDNAKDGVAIFPALDPDGRNFKVFVTGLSGETATVKNPMTGKDVIIQKALELDINIPGQAIDIPPRVQVKAQKWVMK